MINYGNNSLEIILILILVPLIGVPYTLGKNSEFMNTPKSKRIPTEDYPSEKHFRIEHLKQKKTDLGTRLT